MSKNFIQDGNTLTVTAPAAVVSGQGVLVGNIFGVAAFDAAISAEVEVTVDGVFELAKLTIDVVAAGDRLYWDDTNKEVTLASTGNRLIGVATAAAGSGAAVCRVLVGRTPPPDALDLALTATAPLDFGLIGAGASAELTIAVAGAVVGDAVALGLPAAPETGLAFDAFVSAADTVTVRASNVTAAGIDPASATFRVTVFRA